MMNQITNNILKWQLGGPSWTVALGRRDATTASESAANAQLPSPFSDLPTLISAFAAKGLSARDLTVLSGGHSIGQAQCQFFRARIYNGTNIDTSFAASRRSICPSSGGDTDLSPLDSLTPIRFDNNYFSELVAGRGLLISDQVLFDGGSQDPLVRIYSDNNAAFFGDFGEAMIKMGDITPLTGTAGEIRSNCRVVNWTSSVSCFVQYEERIMQFCCFITLSLFTSYFLLSLKNTKVYFIHILYQNECIPLFFWDVSNKWQLILLKIIKLD